MFIFDMNRPIVLRQKTRKKGQPIQVIVEAKIYMLL